MNASGWSLRVKSDTCGLKALLSIVRDGWDLDFFDLKLWKGARPVLDIDMGGSEE